MGDFQPHGEADAIVAETGAGVDTVIVRGEDESGAFAGPCTEEDVLHEGAADRALGHCLAGIVGADFRRVAKRADLAQQARAGFIQRGRVDRMRRAVEDLAEAVDGAGDVELVRRVGLAWGVERERGGAKEERHEQHDEDAKRPHKAARAEGRCGHIFMRRGAGWSVAGVCHCPALWPSRDDRGGRCSAAGGSASQRQRSVCPVSSDGIGARRRTAMHPT